ncbi:MAG: hypothetical protein LBF66_02385 [Holosporales bacterium]|nr:hypothetical protein [Holosporales bacterium]
MAQLFYFLTQNNIFLTDFHPGNYNYDYSAGVGVFDLELVGSGSPFIEQVVYGYIANTLEATLPPPVDESVTYDFRTDAFEGLDCSPVHSFLRAITEFGSQQDVRQIILNGTVGTATLADQCLGRTICENRATMVEYWRYISWLFNRDGVFDRIHLEYDKFRARSFQDDDHLRTECMSLYKSVANCIAFVVLESEAAGVVSLCDPSILQMHISQLAGDGLGEFVSQKMHPIWASIFLFDILHHTGSVNGNLCRGPRLLCQLALRISLYTDLA